MHVDHPLAILAETSATDKSKADAETTAQAVLDLTHTSKKVATTTAPTGTTSTERRESYRKTRSKQVNYSAFEAYFKFTKDSSSVRSALSSQDWMLAVEMEAVTHCIANIALVEAQSENLVLSYMVVFRRLTENKLKSFKFDAMAIEAPRAKDANESSHRRVVRTLDQFSEAGAITQGDKGGNSCVLLDPRTKSSAKKIAVVGDIPRKEEKAIYKDGIDFLRAEHRTVFAGMVNAEKISLSQQSSQSSELSQESVSPFSSPASNGWDDEDELLLGAPIRARKTREEMKETEINARADAVMKDWLDLESEWLEIAQHQNPDIPKEELSKKMSIESQNGMCWALLGLYKHIGVLKWFRDEGDLRFPSISARSNPPRQNFFVSVPRARVFDGRDSNGARGSTDCRRAERQLLLRHNMAKLARLKHDARNTSCRSTSQK
ncbi:hypothetical protein F444_15544 [Phytophthora nicotianae P1976]|uniref:Uncharacterized protein n=1 Tax=Phytophthora nicotianae P1976 TaxID=1317066 RepID=A0A080ZLN5_PHYNI|nr:hypothetical protein F444_15544 [Phytophthora nicotianae P1976]